MSTVDIERPYLRQADADFKMIDCDIHPNVKGGMEGLYPYMAQSWVMRLKRKYASLMDLSLTMRFQHPKGTAWREDLREEDGDLGGTNPQIVLHDHMIPMNTEAAVLNSLQSAGVCAATASVDESIALAAAFNDFFIDNWLSADKRFRYAMIVPAQDVMACVAEVRRVGQQPRHCRHPSAADQCPDGIPVLVAPLRSRAGVQSATLYPSEWRRSDLSMRSRIGGAAIRTII